MGGSEIPQPLRSLGTSSLAFARFKELAQAERALLDTAETIRHGRQRIENRGRYRMEEHGHVDSDGAQRFRYPDPGQSLVKPSPRTQRKSLTIPLLVPETDPPKHLADFATPAAINDDDDADVTADTRRPKSARKPQPLKFLQKYAYKTNAWAEHYGMRSLVESSNNLFKLSSAENLRDQQKRSGRGFAFNYVAAALAVVSSNISRIRTFFRNEAKRVDIPKQRASRRTDPNGIPLRRPNQPASSAGPPR